MSETRSAICSFVGEKHAQSRAILSRLGEADWERQVYSDEGGAWTVRDLLGHLADAERGQLGQLRRLAAGQPTLPDGFDLDRWNRGAVSKARDRSPAELLATIQSAHDGLLALLDELPEADLGRVGRHARGDDITIEAFFRRIAAHRAGHAGEIERALGVG